GARRSGAAAPDIVDHARQRSEQPLAQDTFAFRESASSGPYAPPDPEEIFQAAPEGARNYDRESLLMNSRILEKKLADFGVNGRVVTVHPGPVITMYEFEPAPGVKVNRITNLSDDLALALRALSIRIIAPIPGKSVVGIEVPNPEREVVYIRDLLESRGFRHSPSRLTMALGKDIFGNPVEADLAAMPHLLVAGATGTGKSVFLNSLLCSILCRAEPGDVKLLLVDPKLLELSIYDGIPHLIAEVVTNPKRASAALQGIVKKMEERYQMMAALGVRNISQFNSRVDEALAAGERCFELKARPGEERGREIEYQRLPYIVVVIDELADLMVVSARDVEESLQRLAQMARAAGIHLVLATQRPSVDVLTGIIKANFPARISFQVSSRTDSRTILDQGGAEHLLGMGDMLFLPPGVSKLQRLHGSFVTEREVSALVAHLRDQGKPEFDEALLRLEEESDAREARPEDTDPHYDMAVQIVAESRNASISYIQRRLKVGYNRAARMIEQMEQEGIVGPQIGTKGREIFVQAVHANGDVG
ncbi:MAG: DNA translocase FtsK, partial [Deltaproteobacteria bacterium]|nr:DNA translocase FtsK [Deltaproteobacteria bacterium]